MGFRGYASHYRLRSYVYGPHETSRVDGTMHNLTKGCALCHANAPSLCATPWVWPEHFETLLVDMERGRKRRGVTHRAVPKGYGALTICCLGAQRGWAGRWE